MFGWVWEAVVAVAFGIASAVVPVLNSEAYVLGAGVSGRLDPVVAAIGVGVGQTLGKVAMFLAVRYRPGYAERHHRPEPRALDLSTRWGRTRQWLREASKRMLDTLSDLRYGIPVTLLSSLVGIPPLYAVALIAGASRMRAVTFAGAVLAGRTARFVTLALGISLF
jgi:membrane protein YqaA with SNARE-associated domain